MIIEVVERGKRVELKGYDELVRHNHQSILKINNETLEEAREKGHINEETDKMIYSIIKKGKVVIRIPDWLKEGKIFYETSADLGLWAGEIEKETERAILFKGVILRKSTNIPVIDYINKIFDGLMMTELRAVLPKSQITIYRLK
jgi:hypothetical protein